MDKVIPITKMIHDSICLDSKKGPLESTHEVITRLKFISMVKRDEKINVKTMYIQPKNLFTSFSRLLNQETRDTTLNFLTSTFNRVFEILSFYIYTQKPIDKIFVVNLLKDLILSINGLQNLQNTYAEDRLFVCHIQTLIEMIYSKIREVKEYKPEFFDGTEFNSFDKVFLPISSPNFERNDYPTEEPKL